MQRIFIVDDSKILRFTVTKLFGFSGFQGDLVEFENGKHALDYLIENKDKPEKLPSLILLDINMPILNGFDFLTELNKQPDSISQLEVLMLSSSIDPADISKSKEYKQVAGFLTKPLNTGMVKTIINNRSAVA